MKANKAKLPLSARQRYVVAMVLGTALSTVAANPAKARELPEAAFQAVTDINRYCTACWRNARLHPDCWNDCTQEVFVRLLERVDPDSWNWLLKGDGEERQEFIRAIDTVKKRTQRTRKWSSGLMDSVADAHDRKDRQLREDREIVAKAAAELLSERQRQILQLSFDGWAVHDIAAELKVPAERVSDEKYKAVNKLRSYFNS
jgi:RNA polymerase sigma factor (sigma-70 family)